jgi:hypothetical protein
LRLKLDGIQRGRPMSSFPETDFAPRRDTEWMRAEGSAEAAEEGIYVWVSPPLLVLRVPGRKRSFERDATAR